jgi:hypothetical protein
MVSWLIPLISSLPYTTTLPESLFLVESSLFSLKGKKKMFVGLRPPSHTTHVILILSYTPTLPTTHTSKTPHYHTSTSTSTTRENSFKQSLHQPSVTSHHHQSRISLHIPHPPSSFFSSNITFFFFSCPDLCLYCIHKTFTRNCAKYMVLSSVLCVSSISQDESNPLICLLEISHANTHE